MLVFLLQSHLQNLTLVNSLPSETLSVPDVIAPAIRTTARNKVLNHLEILKLLNNHYTF